MHDNSSHRADDMSTSAILQQGNLRRAFFDRRDTPVASVVFSLSKVCRAISEGTRLDGFEAELVDAANERRGTGGQYMASQCIPFEVFDAIARRDLTAATPSGGGYLTQSATQGALVAFDGSVARQLGVQILSGQKDAPRIPKTTGVLPVTWLSLESSAASEQTPTTGVSNTAPKVASVFVDVSATLLRQGGPLVDAYLNALFLQAAWSALDTAVFAGSGASGQPLGLINDTGITSASGTALALSGIAGIQKTVADNVVSDTTCRWVAATDVRQILQQRVAFASTASPLWAADMVAGRPALASGRMPVAGLLYGDFTEVQVPMWGAGIEIASDPYTQFAAAITRFRLLLTCDVVVPRPGALVRVVTVT